MKLKNLFSDWIIPIIIAIIAAILINKFIIFKAEIPSPSMEPTLNVGDKLFAKRVYNSKNLKRGDLVIFKFESKNELYIKRLIGLPGEEINIVDGVVSINGEILKEDYVKNNLSYNGNFIVPEDSYFFLGDNRANSDDARYWNYPYISSKSIEGKALIKVHPIKELGLLN